MSVAAVPDPRSSIEVCLQLSGVSKRFGNLHVLDDVALCVRHGERRGIIGPNGAGKTTLFNVIAGELAPTSGNVHLYGREITRLPPHARARLGLARTFQTTTLLPGLTVVENLVLSLQALTSTPFQCFVPRTHYRGFREEALRLLRQVQLDHCADWLVRALGHGEQRQVEILMALAQRPKLLLLDEPTAGLSAADAVLVTDMLRAYHRDVAMILIEHDLSVVFNVVERITVLHYGRVVAEESVESIHGNPVVQEIYLGGKL
ncbi:ABC transporter ATP-binding protein [bacterium]|nr:MAG: ABC transporter ATP-binding protein [bacterium]